MDNVRKQLVARFAEYREQLTLVGVIVLVALLSFALGWHAAQKHHDHVPIIIETYRSE